MPQPHSADENGAAHSTTSSTLSQPMMVPGGMNALLSIAPIALLGWPSPGAS